VGSIAAIITAAAALAALIGGYVQFVLRRALLPCIEFDMEFLVLDRSATDQLVGEILLIIRNVGPAVGYVTNVRCRVLYRLSGESGVRQEKRSKGEPVFAHRLPDEGVFTFDREKRFIQSAITQWYRKPLALPPDTCLIHVWGWFEYEISVSAVTGFLAKFLREPRAAKDPTPYAVRRTFAIADGR
jgi:hypothetical protein